MVNGTVDVRELVRGVRRGSHIHVRERSLKRIHAHGTHPAAVVNVPFHVNVHKATPGRMANDDIEALEEISGDKPRDAISSKIDRFFVAEGLRE